MSGGQQASRVCGGTAGYLPAERKQASFQVAKLTAIIKGGAATMEKHAKWDAVFSPQDHPEFDFTYDHHLDRKDAFRLSLKRTVAAHKLVKKNPGMMAVHMAQNYGIGDKVQSGSSAASNHFGIFVGAIMAQASDEQKKEWFSKAINLEMLGAYAQTELGHGSNVRALETTATFDEQTDEFVIDSPTLTSTKWWPGCFGLVATHAIVYARLVLKGKDMGVHSFMVQLRDEKHECMPGIECGDVGPKMGYNLVDSGYCRFDHVRIPRGAMLNKFNMVTRDGQLIKRGVKQPRKKASAKLGYIVMIATRVGMVYGAYRALAKAATIAIRYSAVRHQGYLNTRAKTRQFQENAVLDYQVQQYRLFRWLALAYAVFFSAKAVRGKLIGFRRGLAAGDVSALPELHASAAGLKAFCTNLAGDGIEECRRCCGGHGVTLNSGIAKLVRDYNSIGPIAEGDKIVLALQTARFLVRSVQAARKGKTMPGAPDYLSKPSVRKPDFDAAPAVDALIDAFTWRSHRTAYAATDAFEAELAKGAPFDKAWNACAVALVEAALNHTYLVLLNNFASEISRVQDPAVAEVLTVLLKHFALVQLKENAADWIGVITAKQVGRVSSLVTESLARIRPDAVPLVDAFGFSDNYLQSAIGRYDGNVYEALIDYARKSPLNDKEYIQTFWKESIGQVLNQDFLREFKKRQRVLPSKL